MAKITKADIKQMVERIIGADELWAHDKQTSACFCHKYNELYPFVSDRNNVRAAQRQRLEEEMNKL